MKKNITLSLVVATKLKGNCYISQATTPSKVFGLDFRICPPLFTDLSIYESVHPLTAQMVRDELEVGH